MGASCGAACGEAIVDGRDGPSTETQMSALGTLAVVLVIIVILLLILVYIGGQITSFFQHPFGLVTFFRSILVRQ